MSAKYNVCLYCKSKSQPQTHDWGAEDNLLLTKLCKGAGEMDKINRIIGFSIDNLPRGPNPCNTLK